MYKKKFTYLIIAVIFLISFTVAGCKEINTYIADDYSGENDIIADFSQGLNSGFHSANRYSNGGMFDCTWSSSNVRFNGEKKLLELAFEKEGSTNMAGEYRSNTFFGFGHYSVLMKPIKKVGVVNSFFTYTGRGDRNPHDEIDIEFLCKDTTQVQFNYFTDGTGGHEYIYDLGFDAAEGFHEYGFMWESGSIIWYVDGKAVYKASDNIPSTPGRIMINAWPGKSEGAQSVAHWLGVFDGIYPIPSAEYKWIAFKALE